MDRKSAALTVLVLGSAVLALPPRMPAQASSPAPTPGRSGISRVDFAAAYLRFETIFMEATLGAEATVRINREFDSLTLLFFSGRFGPAIRKLNELAASLAPGAAAGAEARNAAASLAVRLSPPIFALAKDAPGVPSAPSIRVESLYPHPGGPFSSALAVELRDRAGKPAVRVSFSAEFAPDASLERGLSFPGDPRRIAPGMYEAGIAAGGAFIRTGSWTVVRRPLDAVRADNAARLASLRIDPADRPLAQALASIKARNDLLSDAPSASNTAQAVLDLAGLADSVEKEIAILASGKNPFRGSRGDAWRIIATPDKDAPVRVFVPDAAGTGKALPLVIAFHGAGGDENMFMDGYGAGLLKKLAAKMGFIAVSPLTNAFVGAVGPALFDALIETLSAEQAIDRRRVYVLGHSMGGGLVNRLSLDRAGRIAAAACLCGFGGFPAGAAGVPPLLALAAELDPLAPPSRIEPAARKAAESGLPVEYRMVPGFGHTLVVSRELAAVIDWLLRRTLPAA